MKKNLITLSFLGVIGIGSAFGQGFSVEVNAGYGMPMAKELVAYNSSSSDNGMNWSGTDEGVYSSYGAGMNFGLNLAYMLNENLGFGLNTNYLLGSKIESTYSYTTTGYNSSGTTTYKGKMIRITPNIILSAGEGGIQPYAKLGLALGVGSSIDVRDEYTNSTPTNEVMAYKFDQGMAFGGFAELGIAIGIGDNLGVNVALTGYNMNWAPKHGILTEYTVDGIDQLPSMTTYDKEVEFVDEMSYNSGSVPNMNEPDQAIKEFHPFSSLGLNVGFVYKL